MSLFRPVALAVATALALPIAVSAASSDVSAQLGASHRSVENRARDQYRHPAETLKFFGIKPGMTVVEVSPSGGWYTEILAPYLKDKGTYYAAHNNPASSERAAKSVATFQTKLASSPVYSNVKLTAFGKDSYAIAPAGSADAVLTFRNLHNWHMNGFAPQAFTAFAAALKKGGTLGVVEHRLPEDMPDAMQMKSGYMKRSTVVKLAEDAGFRLAGESKVNANPKDTHDYPKGVWTLPPNYAEGDVDRAKYAAIGESDRMTLKFVKR